MTILSRSRIGSLFILSLCILWPNILNCATSQPIAQSSRTTRGSRSGDALGDRTNEAIELSEDWNDVDADLTANSIIEQYLESSWAEDWTRQHGRRPVVHLHPIENRTDEDIDCSSLTKRLEEALIKAGTVDFVSITEEQATAQSEQIDQAQHANGEAAKPQGNETKRDFFMSGWISAKSDSEGEHTVRTYLTAVEIIEAKTQRKVWLGEHLIKKAISTQAQPDHAPCIR